MHRDDRIVWRQLRVELWRDELARPLGHDAAERSVVLDLSGSAFGLPIARRAQKDEAAQCVRVATREVGELDIGVVTRDVDVEPRRAEQPSEERSADIDALDAIQPPASVGSEQDATAHLDEFVGDAEGVHPPRQPEDRDDHNQHGKHDRQRDRDEAPSHDQVDRVAPGSAVRAAQKEAEDALAEAGQHEPSQSHEVEPSA